MSHFSTWQAHYPHLNPAALKWDTMPAQPINQLIHALIRDQLNHPSPAQVATHQMANVLMGLPDGPNRRFYLNLPVLDGVDGQVHRIEIKARLERENTARTPARASPDLAFMAESTQEAQALEVILQHPESVLEGASGLLGRLPPGAVATAVRDIARQFAHEPPMEHAQLVAAGLTTWAFARAFQSFDCEIELFGLVSRAHPNQRYCLTIEAKEAAPDITMAPAPSRRQIN